MKIVYISGLVLMMGIAVYAVNLKGRTNALRYERGNLMRTASLFEVGIQQYRRFHYGRTDLQAGTD